MTFQIKPISDSDREIISNLMKEFWGSEIVVAHGDVYTTRHLPGFKAIKEEKVVGFLHYQIRGKECEIITLASSDEGIGIGSGLIAAIEETARVENCKKLTLITTNDNLHALGFYQRRGFHLTELCPGQIKESRKLKPSIPEIGLDNIPIRDEIHLEKKL